MDVARPESVSRIDAAVIAAFLEISWSYLTQPGSRAGQETLNEDGAREAAAVDTARRHRGRPVARATMAAT